MRKNIIVSFYLIMLFSISVFAMSVSAGKAGTGNESGVPAPALGSVVIQWEKTYGGADWDSAKCVVQTSDGGYAMLGNTGSFGAGRGDMWLVKTNAQGNMEWNKTYGGTEREFASSLLQTRDGGFILAGTTESFGSVGVDVWVVKTDDNGNTQWDKRFGISYIDAVEGERSIVQTSDGGYAVVAFTFASSGSLWLIKMDADGNMQWSRTYGTGWGPESIIVTSDGGFAIAGWALESTGEYDDFLLLKTDSDGKMQWSKTYRGPNGGGGAYSVVQTADGGYALTGDTAGAGYYDIWLVKTDANGNKQWAKTYGGPNIDAGHSLVQVPSGGFAIACWSGGWSDFWLITTDSVGNLQSKIPLSDAGSAWSVIVTDDSGLAVAGDKNADFWLVKLARVSDASVTVVSPSRNWTYQGRAINVSVTVANLGDYANATVNLYYNGTAGNGLIGTKRVALAPNDTDTLTFTWNTTDISPCYSGYNITAVIDISPVIDINLTNNALQSALAVQVRILGDLNIDGKVDIRDLAFVAQFFGSYTGSITSPHWNPNADINADDKVDIRDLTLIAKNFGKTCP